MTFFIRQSFRSFANFAVYKPRPVVVSGPSGSGKSTLIKELFKEFPSALAFSVSHTTRSPRPGEENGREYHFVTRDVMKKMIVNGEFLETTEFSSNLYGTSKKAVEDVAKTGRICVLDVDKQGVKNIRKADLQAIFIYISPPSFAALEKRLRDRKTDTETAIEKRLNEAKESMEFSRQPGVYDHIVLNDKVDVAYADFKSIVRPEIDKVLVQQRSLQ